MEWIYVEERDYLVSHWAGGTTAQIAIAPEGALYSDRDFLWRVSSARVELEESVFTSLPDYHRWISTLAGGMVLSHQGGEKITRTPAAPMLGRSGFLFPAPSNTTTAS